MSGIRATRDEVSDRFPVLGFVIQTGGNPYFEVVLTTQPGQPRDQRTSASFYSTRPQGPLAAERGEAVFLVPPDVLRRFAGASRLYYGVATFADAGRNHPEVLRVPGQNSPYVSLRSFSGRPSRRIQVTPISRRTTGNRYSSPAPEELIWAGDQPQPGSEPLTPPAANGGPGISRPAPGAGETGSPTVNGTPAEAPPTGQGQALDYDDGFGPMPADEGGTAENEGIDYPIDDSLTPAVAAGLGRARALTQAPEYPAADSFVAAKYFQRRSQPRTVNRLVIHITDGSNARAIGTANYFHGDPLGDLAINRVNGELEVEQEGGRMVRFRSGRTWHDSYDGIIHTRNGRSFGRVLRRVSAHYVVGQAGEVVQCVRNNDVAWHASSANGDSIGIEHCASLQFHNPPTQVQYEASAALVCWLCDQLGIPKDREHILGHSEADPGTSHSGCPNTVWDWELYMQLVTSGSCVAAGPGVAEPSGGGGDPHHAPFAPTRPHPTGGAPARRDCPTPGV